TARRRGASMRARGPPGGCWLSPHPGPGALVVRRYRFTVRRTILLAVQPFALIAMSTYRVPVRAVLARTLSVVDLAPSTAVQTRAPGALAYHWSLARGLAATCAVKVATLRVFTVACLGCFTNAGRLSRT